MAKRAARTPIRNNFGGKTSTDSVPGPIAAAPTIKTLAAKALAAPAAKAPVAKAMAAKAPAAKAPAGKAAAAKAPVESTRPTTQVTVARTARTNPNVAATAPAIAVAARGTRPIYNMDVDEKGQPRKLTKKNETQLAVWHGDTRGKQLDSFFAGQLKASRQQFGHSAVFAGGINDNLVIGIPCPSLAFEYLICQDVFPLGLIMQIVGPPGSLKSAFIYEIMRWFRLSGGGSFLAEAETKFSPELLQSIVGFGDHEHNVIVDRCVSVEDWQQRLLFNIKTAKARLMGTKEAPGPGLTVPICFAVDSVSGKNSAETSEKVNAAGHAGRNFPLEALSITSFMKTVPQALDRFPFPIILNNHQKMGKDENGHDVRNITGGKGLNFQESFELETRVRKSKIECSDAYEGWEGIEISIKCAKNSYGPTGHEIRARMLWWDVPGPDGAPRQVTQWDWNWSTVHLLSTLKGMRANILKEAGIHVATPKTSDVENTAWSRNLGMEVEDAVSWSKLGAMISADTKMVDIIRQCLGIRRRPLLLGDYLKQIESLRETLP